MIPTAGQPAAGPDVVVLSHGVHPYPRSAEAIVTGALVDALRARGHDLAVVTSPSGYAPLDGSAALPADRLWAVAPRSGLPAWRHLPRHDPRGLVARAVDRAGAAAGRTPMSVSSWAGPAAAELIGHLPVDGPPPVVWARGLPHSSLGAALRARRRQPFPLICSLGDPLAERRGGGGPGATDRAVARVALRQVQMLGPLADAWTFPCRRVADLVIEAGGLDRSRCFVLPHLVPPSRGATSAGPAAAPPLVVYAGSAYRWVLDGPLLPALARAHQRGLLRAEVALRDADGATRDQAAARLGDGVLHTDLSPEAASLLQDRADALLMHTVSADLLYTKVVEAAVRAVPVLAITPSPGTTAEVVDAAGGVVLDPQAAQAPDATDAALAALVELTSGPAGPAADRRADVARRLGPTTVTDAAEAVIAFARARYEAVHGHTPEPEPPPLPAWP